MIKPREEKWKNFCKYLMDEYMTIESDYENSKTYIQLKELYEKDLVEGIINSNSSLKDKSDWLGLIATKMDNNYEPILRKTKINKIKEKL